MPSKQEIAKFREVLSKQIFCPEDVRQHKGLVYTTAYSQTCHYVRIEGLRAKMYSGIFFFLNNISPNEKKKRL